MKKILTFLSVVTATIMMFSCTNPTETKSKGYNQDMTLEEANEELLKYDHAYIQNNDDIFFMSIGDNWYDLLISNELLNITAEEAENDTELDWFPYAGKFFSSVTSCFRLKKDETSFYLHKTGDGHNDILRFYFTENSIVFFDSFVLGDLTAYGLSENTTLIQVLAWNKYAKTAVIEKPVN